MFCRKRWQEGTRLIYRRLFLSFFIWFETQIVLCHTAPLQSFTDAGAPAENIEITDFQWEVMLVDSCTVTAHREQRADCAEYWSSGREQ